MKAWVWVAIGVGTAAAVVTGVGIAEHYAHAASRVPPQLTQGHLYKVTVVSPGAFSPAPTVAGVQAELDGAAPGEFSVAQVDVLSADSATIFVDVVGPTIPSSQAASALPDKGSITVTDMGLTPQGG